MDDVAPAALDDLITATAGLVSAYVSNNHVQVADMPALIAAAHAALTGLGKPPGPPAEAEIERPTPAQIKKSIRPEGIVSFLDGRTYKTLKRHLTSRGLTPETYRARYGLPSDYPVVAASYSETRSALARSLGLGLDRRAATEPSAEAPPAEASGAQPKTDGEAAPAKPKRAPRARKAVDADA